MPIGEALAVARRIAEALEAAHEKGIVHRDLKPGNVMLDEEGAVKVLDLGLAKAFDGDVSSSPDLSHSPTMRSASSRTGSASWPDRRAGRRARDEPRDRLIR